MEPSTIILFGQAGCGKSTIANVLYQGDVHVKGPNAFAIGDGARGVTSRCYNVKNNIYHVFDTVGLGETDRGTVTEADAIAHIKGYLKSVRTAFHYICFVFKGPRITKVDETLFKSFKHVFEGAERNFVIIRTHAKAGYVEKNRAELQQEFPGVPVVAVDFPASPDEDDPEELEYEKRKRVASRKHLVDFLTGLNNCALEPRVAREDEEGIRRRAMRIWEAFQRAFGVGLGKGLDVVVSQCSLM